MSERPSLHDRLQDPNAVLTRTDVRNLGWERRGVDAIFRDCATIHLPGYSRPVIKVDAYLAYLERHTYGAGGDRVRPASMS